MKKLLALLCATALLIGLAGIATADGNPMKILFISAGGIDDGNFAQDCYLGVQTFLKDHADCTVRDVKETDISRLVPTVEELLGDYDTFVLPGFYFSMIGDIVLANPDKYFLVIDSDITDSEGNPVTANNVYTMTYREQEGGFIAGVAAALTTKTNKVAIINGMAYPTNVRYEFGFMAGVNYANAKYGTSAACVELPSFAGVDVYGNNVGGNYVGSFTDPATGKTLAETLINEGCDVLYAAAGESGNGVMTAVKEANDVWLIGCDTDQSIFGAKGDGNVVVTSSLKVMHLDVWRQLEAISNGTFEGKDAVLGADTDSISFVSEAGRHQLSEETLARMTECLELLKAGTIIPPSDTEYSVTDFPGLK